MNRSQVSKAPVVLGLMGLPGAGKSHLATRVIQATGWMLLDRDQLREHCFPDGRCDRLATRVAEQLMAREMADRIGGGHSLVLDGMTLARRTARDHWATEVQAAGGEWRIVFMDCTVKTAIERVEADRLAGRHPAGDRDAALVQTVARRLERPGEDEPVRTLAEAGTVKEILAWLETPL